MDNRSTNTIITIVVLIVVVVLLVLYFAWPGSPVAPVEPIAPAPSAPVLPPPTVPIITPPATSPKTAVVTYTDAGYLQPSKTFIVDIGTTVTFHNDSSVSMRTASADHPTHTVYPTTGGCLGSTFDSCQDIPPGGEWSFRFDIPGIWDYHDHLHPARTGTIVVR